MGPICRGMLRFPTAAWELYQGDTEKCSNSEIFLVCPEKQTGKIPSRFLSIDYKALPRPNVATSTWLQ